jgi:hypothetical protein
MSLSLSLSWSIDLSVLHARNGQSATASLRASRNINVPQVRNEHALLTWMSVNIIPMHRLNAFQMTAIIVP